MKPVILDTDIGYDPDDLFALNLILNSPEFSLELVITGDEVSGKRAQFTKQLLTAYGYGHIPVASGIDLGRDKFVVDSMLNPWPFPVHNNYLAAAKRVFDAHESVAYINIQGFSNLAALIDFHPDIVSKLEYVQMGGAIEYSRDPGWVEHNVAMDIPSAKKVFDEVFEVTLITAQTTHNPIHEVKPGEAIYELLKNSTDQRHKDLLYHSELWCEHKGFYSMMHDPLTVAAALGYDFVDYDSGLFEMNEYGELYKSVAGALVRYSLAPSKGKEFMQYLEDALFSEHK